MIFWLTRVQTFTAMSLNNPVYGQHLIIETSLHFIAFYTCKGFQYLCKVGDIMVVKALDMIFVLVPQGAL